MRKKIVLILALVGLLIVSGLSPLLAQDAVDPDSGEGINTIFLPMLSQGSNAPRVGETGDVAPASTGQENPATHETENVKGKPAAKVKANSVYIVELAEMPVVAYRGGIPGLKATKPQKGQKINPNSPDVVRYVQYLDNRHEQALNAVGGGRKLYNYRYTFNGFAAELTEAQAAKLAELPGVLAVSADELQYLDTSSTPDFLGLTAANGIWDQLGGRAKAGENVIIGIVDGGIWPEHPSFSDRTGIGPNGQPGKLDYRQIPGWHGRCVPGEEFTAANCNQKLIGAQYYNSGWGGNAGIDAQLPWEYNSPRDFGGHGTHVASTAGGNYGVQATGPAAVFGSISGVAPRARIASYKVCWQAGSGGSCFTTDSVAAIDQAVADGVDVINFSISGSRTNFRDPVEIAFLFAADAGVFVAASAGNSGPTTSTVAHPGPWLTTVAAGTHNRNGNGSVTLGNDHFYAGASVATAVGPAPLVDSVYAGMAGADPTQVQLCYPGTLDPAVITGKIVLCLRGVIARVDKSFAVMEAGGVGMIMYNSPDSSLNADFHFVPTVHVNQAAGLAIKGYIAADPSIATATIANATIVYDLAAPFTASFSSRGPLLAGGGDLLKPDVIAPGQDILAAVAPPGNSGRSFDLYSGTSMSSPHVAGLAALLKHKYPTWSPMMIKSALMTTASDVLDGGTPAPNTNPVLIFRQGAGHVRPNSAVSPGLVFDSGFNDWLGFMCGTGQLPSSTCAFYGAAVIDPSDLNVASIAIGDLAGVQTVKRTVTNVGGTSTYNVSLSGLTGFDVSFSPTSFTLAPGQKQTVEITIARTTAALNAYTGGQITWTDGVHNVRIPVVVRPVAMAAPTQVSGIGNPLSYNVTFGYDGAFTAAPRGLVPAAINAGTLSDDPTDGDCTLISPNAVLIPVIIPAATTYARFSLFDADVNPGSDIDLCVFRGGNRVGISASGTSAEEVNLLNPAADTYTVVVQGWGVAGSTPFKLHTWLLGATDTGNMSVSAPASATTAATGTINLTFSGLASATKYLGSVAYSGVVGLPNPTIVRVDTP
jgi:subtilisin family serine protease